MKNKKIAKLLDKKIKVNDSYTSIALFYNNGTVIHFAINELDDNFEWIWTYENIDEFNKFFKEEMDDNETITIEYLKPNDIDENVIKIKQWCF